MRHHLDGTILLSRESRHLRYGVDQAQGRFATFRAGFGYRVIKADGVARRTNPTMPGWSTLGK